MSRFVPFIRTELPRLASRHHANNTFPSVSTKFTKFRKGLDTIDDEILHLSYCLLSTPIDGCTFSVNWDKIFRVHITLGSSSGASILRRFESDSFDKLQSLTINDRRSKMTYIASSRNCLTLCIVIRTVGDEDIMMIG